MIDKKFLNLRLEHHIRDIMFPRIFLTPTDLTYKYTFSGFK